MRAKILIGLTVSLLALCLNCKTVLAERNLSKLPFKTAAELVVRELHPNARTCYDNWHVWLMNEGTYVSSELKQALRDEMKELDLTIYCCQLGGGSSACSVPRINSGNYGLDTVLSMIRAVSGNHALQFRYEGRVDSVPEPPIPPPYSNVLPSVVGAHECCLMVAELMIAQGRLGPFDINEVVIELEGNDDS